MHSHAHAHGPCGPRHDLRVLGPWLAMMGPGPGGPEGGGPRRGRGRGGRGGPWGMTPPGGPWARRGRARRGDVRAAALLLLDEEPRNGYAIMQAIEERSDGVWRPSPGSVYPALAQLEDEGLIRVVEDEGRKTFHLTDAGKAHVEDKRGALGEPWKAASEAVDDATWDLMNTTRQVGMAAGQLSHAGTPEQQRQAQKVLADARRALYRILAEDDPSAAEDDPDA